MHLLTKRNIEVVVHVHLEVMIGHQVGKTYSIAQDNRLPRNEMLGYRLNLGFLPRRFSRRDLFLYTRIN